MAIGVTNLGLSSGTSGGVSPDIHTGGSSLVYNTTSTWSAASTGLYVYITHDRINGVQEGPSTINGNGLTWLKQGDTILQDDRSMTIWMA